MKLNLHKMNRHESLTKQTPQASSHTRAQHRHKHTQIEDGYNKNTKCKNVRKKRHEHEIGM